MKNFTFVFLFSLFFTSSILSQSLEEFSELSGTETALFNSVLTNEGIVYFISELPSNRLVKIDWSGNIVNDVMLPFTDSLYFNGQLIVDEEKIYLVGVQRLYPNDAGTNNDEIWNSQRRAVVEINSDLTIAEIQLFDIIPFGAGEVVGQSGTYVGTNYPSSISIKNNQLKAVWSYAIFDTQSPVSNVIGSLIQYEQIDLLTDESSVQAIEDATLLIDVLLREDDFWIYGDVADTIIGDVAFNQRPVGHYSNSGEKLNSYFFDEAGSGAFSDGSIGLTRDGLFYSAYFGRSVDSEGCEEDNTVIDVRDADFNLINRVKLPDCDLFAYGKNSFAFTSTGDFYFHAYGGGNIAIYKFDTNLNVLCSEIFSMSNELPISLKMTPDDEVILETLYNSDEIKLYSFSCEADPISFTISSNSAPKITIFPNPTSNEFFIEAEGRNDLSVEVSSLLGHSLLKKMAIETNINLSQFSAGIYIVKIYDNKTGELIEQQKVFKL